MLPPSTFAEGLNEFIFLKSSSASQTSLWIVAAAYLCRDFLCLDLLFHGKRNCIRLGLAPQVVHASLEPLAPTIKVHARHLFARRLCDKDVERLALANKRAPVSRQINQRALLDLPHRLVDVLHPLGNPVYRLHRALGS